MRKNKFLCIIFSVSILATSCGKPENFKFKNSIVKKDDGTYFLSVKNETDSIKTQDLIENDAKCKYYFTIHDKKEHLDVLDLECGDTNYDVHVKKEIYLLTIHRNYMFTVSFNAGEYGKFNDVNAEEGTYVNPPLVSKEGYKMNWDYDFSLPITRSFTTNLVVTPNKYEVTLDANGGKTSKETIIVTYNDSYTLPTPKRSGYHFEGWYDEFGNLVGNGIYTRTGNMLLKAKWSIITYKITYDLNGGTTTETFIDKYTVEDEVPLPEPTKSGYNFGGWIDDNSKGYRVKIQKGTTGDLNLKAYYGAKFYKLTFDVGDGYWTSNSEQILQQPFDSLIAEPNYPIHKDLLFKGWYVGDHKWDFSVDKMVNEDLTLTAQYYLPEEEPLSNFSYELKNGDLFLYKYLGNSDDVRIPNTVDYIYIKEQCFIDMDVKQIYICAKNLYLYSDCITFCSKLQNIVIKRINSQNHLGSYSIISDCVNLVAVSINNALRDTYESNGFLKNCTKLSLILIENSYGYLFQNCPSVQKIVYSISANINRVGVRVDKSTNIYLEGNNWTQELIQTVMITQYSIEFLCDFYLDGIKIKSLTIDYSYGLPSSSIRSRAKYLDEIIIKNCNLTELRIDNIGPCKVLKFENCSILRITHREYSDYMVPDNIIYPEGIRTIDLEQRITADKGVNAVIPSTVTSCSISVRSSKSRFFVEKSKDDGFSFSNWHNPSNPPKVYWIGEWSYIGGLPQPR